MTASAAFQFTRWLVRLNGQLTSLTLHLVDYSRSEVERKANTARAGLQHLYLYAEQHAIDITPYLATLSAIETRLETLRDWLTRRPAKEWWRQALGFVVSALGIVANLVGLGSFFSRLRLPGPQRPRLLP
jgi:hypothetical protein